MSAPTAYAAYFFISKIVIYSNMKVAQGLKKVRVKVSNSVRVNRSKGKTDKCQSVME